MSIIAVQGNASGSGTVTVEAPNTNSNITLALPSRAGNIAVDGPAFAAYASTTQSLSNNSLTKLVLGAEEFDTASCFDSTTNYRFTPNVAGYYQFNVVATLQGGAGSGAYQLMLVKNGSGYKRTSVFGTVDLSPSASNIFYLNGSTDYVEAYVYQNSGSTKTVFGSGSDAGYTYMTGCLVRAA